MPNYQNSKIYRIISLSNPDLIYYGSTTVSLCRRFAHHKDDYKSGKGVTSKQILQYEDAKIMLVENYPCNSKEELLKKEYEYIINNQCVNIQKGYNMKEYYQENKEKIKEQANKYYETNREERLKYSKEYRKNNRDICLERQRLYSSQIVVCEICKLEMRKDNLTKHNKKIHRINI